MAGAATRAENRVARPGSALLGVAEPVDTRAILVSGVVAQRLELAVVEAYHSWCWCRLALVPRTDVGCSAVRNAFGSRAGHGHSVCSAGGAEGRLGCSGTTARPTSARRPSRCARPPPSAASAGCRTTGRATADPRPTQAATWRPRPPTWPASPTRWASSGSRSWAIPAGPPTPWPAPRCCQSGSWPRSVYPAWLPTTPRARLVRGHGRRRGATARRR
jgi:hypothetical protein